MTNPMKITIAILAFAGLLISCSKSQKEPAPSNKLQVFVSIPPLAFFAEQLGGDLIEVRSLLPPGQDPHTYEPLPSTIADLSRADIFFTVGLPFEEVLAEKVRHSSRNLVIRSLSQSSEHAHHAKPAEDPDSHHHGAEDLHTWLSPRLIPGQAHKMTAGFIEIDPGHADDYSRRLDTFLKTVAALDSALKTDLAPYEHRTFYVFHPAFGHFAEAYGLHQRSIEFEGKTPAPRQLQDLIEQARSENVRTLFVQPQFSPSSVNSVAEALGAEIVALDPLAQDVFANLRTISTALIEAFEESR